MKYTLSALLLCFFSSAAFACPGGILQVIGEINDDPVVVASYSIRTGKLLASNKSLHIHDVQVLNDNNETEDTLCADGNCRQLSDVSNKNLLVTYSLFGTEGKLTKVIRSVSLGANAPVAKGLSDPNPDLLSVLSCSKK